MRVQKPILVLVVTTVAALGTSGCTGTRGNPIPQFESTAKTAGYNRVETVPPVDNVNAMRSCRGDGGEILQFAVFDSEESRRHWADTIVAGENPTTIMHADWVIAGESEEVVKSIASNLGANATES